MSDTTMTPAAISQTPLPLPQINVSIRAGVMSDLPFMDALQKLHTKQVGWMPTKQFEGKINAGHVLIAEEVGSGLLVVGSEESCVKNSAPSLPTTNHPLPTPVGYCIGNDQYFKRDDVGIIYQMNVLPGRQRGLIGATLLKAMFDRSAYGCKLFCCWCAQDLAANKFWEAMGFVPLAFRTGSEKKSRTHIFWQKRIREGDTTTPWWFPAKTAGGSIREDRIVLPIPPGTHWSDAKPLLLPAQSAVNEVNILPGPNSIQKLTPVKRPLKTPKTAITAPDPIRRNGLLHDIPKQGDALPKPKRSKQSNPKPDRPNRKCDPRLIAAARELRDRWLEQVNANPAALITNERYAVSKPLIAASDATTLALPHEIAA